jgi:hypothetical protein
MKNPKKVLPILGLLLILVGGLGVLLSSTNHGSDQRFLRVAEQMYNIPADDLILLNSEAADLQMLGRTIHRAKVLNTKTEEVIGIALDEWGQAVDYEKLKKEEKMALAQRYGKLTPKLYNMVISDFFTGNVPVAIWLNIDQERIPGRDKNRDAAMADLRTLVADTTEDLEGELISRGITVDYVSTLAPLIYAQVSKADLADDGWLQQREDVQIIYDAMNDLEDHLYYQTKSVRAPAVWGYGITGSGVTVAIVEDSRVDFNNTCLPHNGGTRVPADSNVDHHATACAGMVGSSHATYKGAAYGATIRSSNATTYNDPDIAAALDDAGNYANVINNSWGSTYPDGTFSVHTRHADWIARNTARVVIGSAGNSGDLTGYEYVSQVAAGFNTIAVGSYDDNHTGLWSDDTMSSFSSYRDPTGTGASYTHEKPEVAAPGQDPTTGYSGYQTYGIYSLNMVQPASYCGLGGVGWGTSYSAPIVAGIAALMMDRAPSYVTNWPEIYKAAIMTSAINNIEGSTKMSEYDGAGGVSAKKGDKIIRRGDFSNGILNDATWARGDIVLPIDPITTAGRKHRITLCWTSNPANSPYATDPLNWDVDLYLYIDGAYAASSSSVYNPFEIIEYTPSAAQLGKETYIRIHQYSGGGTTYYGVAWGKY